MWSRAVVNRPRNLIATARLLTCHSRSLLLRASAAFGDEFRKPIWFDECDSDDELYGGGNSSSGGGAGGQQSDAQVFAGFHQVFTNPLEMQRHFERQVDEMMRSLHQFESEFF